MTQQRLYEVADIIVNAEKIIQTSDDTEEIKNAQTTIVEAAKEIRTLDDIEQLDEIISQKLKILLDL